MTACRHFTSRRDAFERANFGCEGGHQRRETRERVGAIAIAGPAIGGLVVLLLVLRRLRK